MEVLNTVNIGVADYFFEKFVCRLEDKELRYIISKNIFMYEKLNSILYNLTQGSATFIKKRAIFGPKKRTKTVQEPHNIFEAYNEGNTAYL